MAADTLPVVVALNQRYLLDFPHEAARRLEAMPPAEIGELIAAQPPHAVVRAWAALAPDVARAVLQCVPDALGRYLLAEAEPAASAAVLAQLDAEERDRRLVALNSQIATELRELLQYPDASAGRLMDPNVSPLRTGMSVTDALARLRTLKRRGDEVFACVVSEGEAPDAASRKPKPRPPRLKHWLAIRLPVPASNWR